jgi:ribosome maturation factor RimP
MLAGLCARRAKLAFFYLYGLVPETGLVTEVEQTKTETEILAVAEGLALSMGIEIVEFRFLGSGANTILRIDLDRAGPVGVTLDDCQRFSIALEMTLDDRDLIDHAYTLEASSPGMDRPIATNDDIRRNTGRKVTAEIRSADGATTQVVGILIGIEDGTLVLGPVEAEPGGRLPWTEVVDLKQFLPF